MGSYASFKLNSCFTACAILVYQTGCQKGQNTHDTERMIREVASQGRDNEFIKQN